MKMIKNWTSILILFLWVLCFFGHAQVYAQALPLCSELYLTLVKRIVEHYGGRIWLDSAGEGQGTCFRFTLPLAMERHDDR